MRLTKIRIKNFRSITDTGDIRVEPLQAFVGENNAGKSNILKSLSCFLSAGAGGMKVSDFKNIELPAFIECTFDDLTGDERRRLRPYLLNNSVVLQKKLWIEHDEGRGKSTVKSEYHGYQANPVAVHLSIEKCEEKYGARPKWEEIAKGADMEDYVRDETGKVTKASYKKGIERFILENDVEFETPVLGETQALGIPQNLLNALPRLYLLPAITDYSDEVDRRQSSSVFRRLMSDLADRAMKADPRYVELDAALSKVRALLNPGAEGNVDTRLTALTVVEEKLRDLIQQLMPSVRAVALGVEVEASQDIFAKGVSIRIDDGVLTDVLDKGHGMQRNLVFSLLQMLMSTEREADAGRATQPIILAIEEPELYIHPHCQRLIFRVLKQFAGLDSPSSSMAQDQVIYTTHSPSFVEVWNYERIGMVHKPNLATGTVVKQAASSVLDGDDDRKTFKILTCFGLRHNEVFFGRSAIVVEGPEDEVAIIAAARKMGRIIDLPDELGVTILVASGKGDIPKFQKVLNAFAIDHGVLFEKDGHDDSHNQNAPILSNAGVGRLAAIDRRLEDLVGMTRHFADQREAKSFFSVDANISDDLCHVVRILLPQTNEIDSYTKRLP